MSFQIHDFIIPLSNDIFFLKGETEAKYPFSNSILIGNYLIDTGISRKRLKLLKKMDFSIDNIIYSHYHEDHIRDALFVEGNRYCHLKDKPIIENPKLYKKYYGIKEIQFDEIFESFRKRFRIKELKIDRVISDNEIIEVNENCRLKVIHTPGHTAGHCSFMELNSGIVYLTDIDFKDFGPWYGGQDSSLSDFEKSITKLKKIDMDIAISAHKGIFEGRTLIREKLDEYQAIIDNRNEKILEYFSEKYPIKVEDLLQKKIIYKYFLDIDLFKEFQIRYEKQMLKLHFERLLQKNIIESKGDGFILA